MEQPAQARADLGRFIQAGVVEQQREFLATGPRRHVRIAAGRGQQTRHFHQHHVAHRMAVPVVHFLEVIDIQHHQTQRVTAALRTGEIARQCFIECTPVR